MTLLLLLRSPAGLVGTVNPATETDSSIALGRTKRKTIGVNTETDTPVALVKRKRLAIGTAIEVDSAEPITRTAGPIGVVIETDISVPLGKRKSKAISATDETDAAQPLTRRKRKAISPAVEVDVAPTLPIPMWHFEPPTYPIWKTYPKMHRGPRYHFEQGISIIRKGGVLTPVRSPSPTQLVGTPGVDYFLGGRLYTVNQSTRSELIAAGFEVGESV